MKARVIATGKIVDVAEYSTIYAENYDACFYPNELEFLDNSEDYWTRLEHQYAGMMMQGILSNQNIGADVAYMVNLATECATALVEKLKSEEKK